MTRVRVNIDKENKNLEAWTIHISVKERNL